MYFSRVSRSVGNLVDPEMSLRKRGKNLEFVLKCHKYVSVCFGMKYGYFISFLQPQTHSVVLLLLKCFLIFICNLFDVEKWFSLLMLRRILICSNTFAMSCIACVFSCGFLKPRTIDFLKIFIANKAFPNGAMTSSSWASGGACWNYICWSFLLESVLVTYCKYVGNIFVQCKSNLYNMSVMNCPNLEQIR